MSAEGVMRFERLKGASIILKAANHNKRTHGATTADPRLTHLNSVIRGPSTAADVAALAKGLTVAAGIHKPTRHDAVSALEFVFSLPADSTIPLPTYFSECADWVARHFGGEQNILSADIHRDEPAPHCHVLLLPLINGRMNGSKLFGTKARLIALQDNFHAEVARRYGLRRAPQRLTGTAKREGAKQVLDRLREDADVIMLSAVWPATSDAIVRFPEPFMADLGITRETTPTKTFKQIALSTGKGPRTAAAAGIRDKRLTAAATRRSTKHIGFDVGIEGQSLSCVGFPDSTATYSPPPACPEPPVFSRHRDCDLDPADFDPETGEHIAPQVQTQSGKAADAWAAGKLAALVAAKSARSRAHTATDGEGTQELNTAQRK